MSTIGTLSVILNLDGKQFTRNIKRAKKEADTFGTSMRKWVDRNKYALLALAGTVAIVASQFLNAAAEAEGYRVALGKILNSQDQANVLFQDMAKYASSVSLEYKDIMQSATALSGIMTGGSAEVRKWMPLLGDLAAYAQNLGVSMPEVTSQIIRYFSAGAAAADLFREKGINALLGFKAGVHYSVEDTKKILMNAWTDPQSKFKGMATEMLDTWRGKMSLLKDAWFQFQVAVMDSGIGDYFKDLVDWTTKLVNGMKRVVDTPMEVQISNLSEQYRIARQELEKMQKTGKVLVTNTKFPFYSEAGTKELEKQKKLVEELQVKLNAMMTEYYKGFGGGGATPPAGPSYPTKFTTPESVAYTQKYGPKLRGIPSSQQGSDALKARLLAESFAERSKYNMGPGGTQAEKIKTNKEMEGFARQLSETEARFVDFSDKLRMGWSNTMEDMLTGAQKFGDGIKNMFNQILQSYMSMVAQMAGQKLFNATVGSGMLDFLPGMSNPGVKAGGNTIIVQGQPANQVMDMVDAEMRFAY